MQERNVCLQGKSDRMVLFQISQLGISLLFLVLLFSVSKNFKKKSKGKSDDKKLKVKPKTFPKEIKSDNSVGVKRKANDTDGVGTKQFKTKKWKGEKKHDTMKKGLLGKEKENKESDSKVKQKFIKESKKRGEKGIFDTDKTRKRKLDADGGQRDSVKKKKSSEVEEGMTQMQ